MPSSPATPQEPHKAFKSYELHIDVKQLPQRQDETLRRTLFVAIDRAHVSNYSSIVFHSTCVSLMHFSPGAQHWLLSV